MAAMNYSFIIPHKNCPDLLQRCIASIPQREDIQIIVVDDNSDEDKFPRNVRADVDLISISKQDSKGAGHARNVGMEKAVGRWVLFADADDFYSDGFMDILDGYVDSSYDVVYFNFMLEVGCLLKEEDKALWAKTQNGISQRDADYVRYRFHVPWNKMISKNFIREHHICFEETIIGNDVQFSLMLGFCLEKYEIIDKPLYHYYTNNQSLSFGKRSIDKLMVIIEGWYKVNAFNVFIQHQEWNTNPYIGVMFMMWRDKKRAIPIFCRYLLKLPDILKNRNRYVELLADAAKKQ